MLSPTTLNHIRSLLDPSTPPASPADQRTLDALQARCGIALPPAHRALLAAGLHGPFATWMQGPKGAVLEALCGPRTDHLDLAQAIEWAREEEDLGPAARDKVLSVPRLPPELVPIATLVPSPDHLCIDAQGALYIYNHERNPPASYNGTLATARHIKKIADDADAFFRALKPWKSRAPKIHAVLGADDLEALKAYLAAGHAPNETDRHGQSLLYLAALADAKACTQHLCTLGANDPEALSAAAFNADCTVLKILLESGIRPDHPNLVAARRARNKPALALLKAAMGESAT